MLLNFLYMCMLLFFPTACEPFHFKNTLSNTEMCKPCPLFSNTSELAMEVYVHATMVILDHLMGVRIL